jgi:hypothetical protein
VIARLRAYNLRLYKVTQVTHIEISTVRRFYTMKINKYRAYEIEKAKIESLNLPHEQYEKAMRDLARRLKI